MGLEKLSLRLMVTLTLTSVDVELVLGTDERTLASTKFFHFQHQGHISTFVLIIILPINVFRLCRLNENPSSNYAKFLGLIGHMFHCACYQ